MKKKYTNPSIEVCEIDSKCVMIDTSVCQGSGDPEAKGANWSDWNEEDEPKEAEY